MTEQKYRVVRTIINSTLVEQSINNTNSSIQQPIWFKKSTAQGWTSCEHKRSREGHQYHQGVLLTSRGHLGTTLTSTRSFEIMRSMTTAGHEIMRSSHCNSDSGLGWVFLLQSGWVHDLNFGLEGGRRRRWIWNFGFSGEFLESYERYFFKGNKS